MTLVGVVEQRYRLPVPAVREVVACHRAAANADLPLDMLCTRTLEELPRIALVARGGELAAIGLGQLQGRGLDAEALAILPMVVRLPASLIHASVIVQGMEA